MAEKLDPITESLPETTLVIDLSTAPEFRIRTVPRHRCRQVRLTRIVAKPGFQCLRVRVQDISIKGICLRCPEALAPGTRLAINWEFGAPECHRTVLARVVHVSLESDQLWSLGCEFEAPLTREDVENLLGSQ